MSVPILTALLTLTLVAPRAGACIGAAKDFDISFAADDSSEGSMIIKRKVNGADKEELRDDTGYLGAYLSNVYLQKSGATISQSANSSTIKFMRMRLAHFKKKVQKHFPNANDVQKSIDEVEKQLTQPQFSPADLSQKWNKLEEALRAAPVPISASARGAGSKTWGREESLSQFALPSASTGGLARGGCGSSSIKNFDSNVGVQSAPQPKPASTSGPAGFQDRWNAFQK